MKRFSITFTIYDEQMEINTEVEGFSGLEMLAALDIKREDIMNQSRKFPDGTEMEVTKDDDLNL